MNNNYYLDEVILEIEDQFSISLQYYKLDEIENGNKHLVNCIQLINSIQLHEGNIQELRAYLLNKIEEVYEEKAYTIYIA